MEVANTKKYRSIPVSVALLVCMMLPSSAFADSAARDLSAADMVDSNGIAYLFDVETDRYLPIRQREAKAAAITQRNRTHLEFEQQLDGNRATDTRLLSKTARARAATEDPVPGGVGYGAFFQDQFQYGFTSGTSLLYSIICPSQVGGNVYSHLYLTSTNRAAKGVEAFISYLGQDTLVFKVFDWAQPESDRWQVYMPYSELSDYLTTQPVNGEGRQIVTVQNTTVQVSSTQWMNAVWLKNYRTNSFDRVYSYTYNVTLSDQRDSHYGEWGPIVETFQEHFENTNVVGFNNVYFKSKTTDYTSKTWNDWELLTDDVSYIRNDGYGFMTAFRRPNYTFGVYS
ncbi:hypothetical protein D2E26_0502 [Bifidobacterium dolichotidis]|uniref:Uncharacterized protein n=1 Tax=Bifidobacterium dolichotidis TaxID=2306976 RepID=A0A430FSW0_9BIFI|nr:hypothetical protein [Bifidobacterium dolichotidis]RSX55939.1 hypothetical protein D2E26_0502 [Bifidobacterium dolichotidis]